LRSRPGRRSGARERPRGVAFPRRERRPRVRPQGERRLFLLGDAAVLAAASAGGVTDYPHHAHQNQLGGRKAVITRPAAITPIQHSSEAAAKARAAKDGESSGPSAFTARAVVR